METISILREIQNLPLKKQIYIADRIIKSIRQRETKMQMEIAAHELYNDYLIYDTPTNGGAKAINPEFTGILSGYVSDYQTILPVTGAILTLQGTHLSAISNENGEFSKDNIPQGIYTLTVTADTYQPYTQSNIQINADEQTEVGVKMGKVG